MKNTQVMSLLMQRLERISADSIWAHHASGVRGSLLKLAQQLEEGQPVDSPATRQLIDYGFQILERAAREKIILSPARKRKGS